MPIIIFVAGNLEKNLIMTFFILGLCECLHMTVQT